MKADNVCVLDASAGDAGVAGSATSWMVGFKLTDHVSMKNTQGAFSLRGYTP
jgi:hypothetical protein